MNINTDNRFSLQGELLYFDGQPISDGRVLYENREQWNAFRRSLQTDFEREYDLDPAVYIQTSIQGDGVAIKEPGWFKRAVWWRILSWLER